MRAGDSTPININLADGQVLRFACTALPDGGRMLSYTPVTDLVRHGDAAHVERLQRLVVCQHQQLDDEAQQRARDASQAAVAQHREQRR